MTIFARLSFARLSFARLSFARLSFARLSFARLSFARRARVALSKGRPCFAQTRINVPVSAFIPLLRFARGRLGKRHGKLHGVNASSSRSQPGGSTAIIDRRGRSSPSPARVLVDQKVLCTHSTFLRAMSALHDEEQEQCPCPKKDATVNTDGRWARRLSI